MLMFLYSTGEPVWAETSRIISQIFLLLIFVAFLVFVIRQAITSPNVTQRIEEPAAQVDVPGKAQAQLVKYCCKSADNAFSYT